MTRTYAIEKDRKGWVLCLVEDSAGWLGKPSVMGRYKSRKAALVVASLLAGRTARIVIHPKKG
jgi:hypothetical protein